MSGLPVWKMGDKYLFHDSSYRGWVLKLGLYEPSSVLESQLTPDCPTKVNMVNNDWWDYANGNGKGGPWLHDKKHQLHVECFQPGSVNATMKPSTADSDNMIDLVN